MMVVMVVVVMLVVVVGLVVMGMNVCAGRCRPSSRPCAPSRAEPAGACPVARPDIHLRRARATIAAP